MILNAVGEDAHEIAVEQVHVKAGQMHEPSVFAGEDLACMSPQALADRRVQSGSTHEGARVASVKVV